MATFRVNTSSDIVDLFDGLTSLREAVAQAQTIAGVHLIIFDVDEVTLSATLVLDNPGGLLIDGDRNDDGIPDVTIRSGLSRTDGFASLIHNTNSSLNNPADFVEISGVTFEGFVSDNSRVLIDNRSAGVDAAPVILNGPFAELALSDVVFQDITLRAADGRQIEYYELSGPGEPGTPGNHGGDASVIVNDRLGTLLLTNVTFEENVLLDPGRGSSGGNGGDGFDGRNGGRDDFFGDGGPGGDGGMGGNGGDSGDHGDAYRVGGAGLVSFTGIADRAVVELREREVPNYWPDYVGLSTFGDAGLPGEGGEGGEGGTGNPLTGSDGPDGQPGPRGLFGFPSDPTQDALFVDPLAGAGTIGETVVSLRGIDFPTIEGDTILVDLLRIGDLTGDLSVLYQISASSFGNGFDAADLDAPMSGIVAMPSGQSNVQFGIPTINDALDEAEFEGLTIEILGISSPATLQSAPGVSSVTTSILENPTLVTAGAVVADVQEGETAVFGISRIGASGDFDVSYILEPGLGVDAGDIRFFDPMVGTVSFSADGPDDLNVQVQTLLDNIPEGTETFSMRLLGVSNESPGFEPVEVDPIAIDFTISDRTADAVINLENQTNSAFEGEDFVFQLTRSGLPNSEVVVNYEITAIDSEQLDFGGFETFGGSARFMPGGPDVIDVRQIIADDDLAEGPESFIIQVSSAFDLGPPGVDPFAVNQPAPGFVAIAPSAILAVIEPNDPVTVDLVAVDVDVTEGQSLQFEVQRSGGTGSAFVVEYTIAGGNGFNDADLAQPAQLTGILSFTANGPDSQTVTIDTVDDTLAEGIEDLQVSITGITEIVPTGAIIRPGVSSIQGQIEASDPVAVALSVVDTNVVEGELIQFEIQRSGGTGGSFSVDYAITGTNGFNRDDLAVPDMQTGTVVFAADGANAVPASIQVLDDLLAENAENFSVAITGVDGINPEGLIFTQGGPISGLIAASDLETGQEPAPSPDPDPTPGDEPPEIVQRVARLYEAALDRDGEYLAFDGFNFWVDKAEQGADFRVIASAFLRSPEFRGKFGEALDETSPDYLSNVDYVDALYTSVLGREGGQGGRQFWIDKLDFGGGNRSAVLRDFAESPENVANTAPLIGQLFEATEGYWVFL